MLVLSFVIVCNCWNQFDSKRSCETQKKNFKRDEKSEPGSLTQLYLLYWTVHVWYLWTCFFSLLLCYNEQLSLYMLTLPTFTESPFTTWKSAVSISVFIFWTFSSSSFPHCLAHWGFFFRADSSLDIWLRLNECFRLCTHNIHTKTLNT